jgi:hypothetical protein
LRRFGRSAHARNERCQALIHLVVVDQVCDAAEASSRWPQAVLPATPAASQKALLVSLDDEARRNVLIGGERYAIALPSSKTPPVGPSGDKRTPHSTLAAPCSTERGASRPPMSVRAHPGLIALTSIPRGFKSSANTRAIAFNAALLAP